MFPSITWPTTHLWRSSCWEPTPSVTPWRQSASSGTSSQFWPSSPSLSVPRTSSPKTCLSTTSEKVRSCQPLFAWSRSTEFSSNYQHSSSGRVPSSPLGKHLLHHVQIPTRIPEKIVVAPFSGVLVNSGILVVAAGRLHTCIFITKEHWVIFNGVLSHPKDGNYLWQWNTAMLQVHICWLILEQAKLPF